MKKITHKCKQSKIFLALLTLTLVFISTSTTFANEQESILETPQANPSETLAPAEPAAVESEATLDEAPNTLETPIFPLVVPSSGKGKAIGDTIAQSFPDANLAKAVADAVSGGNVDATLTQPMIDSLTNLNASNRGITDASGIEQLTNLTLLRLEKNQLTSLPSTINQLTLLKHLNLGENALTSLPENITNIPSLEVLYLNNNQLETIPESINNLSKLTLLAIGNNKLTEFPKNVDQIVTLDELSLDHNQISSIPDSIGNLTKLEYLYLNHNQLTTVPDCFNQFPNLDTLWLNNNQLSLFPTTIAGLSNLVELRIHSNEIAYLPEDMSSLSSLKYLILANNQLTSLPASMGTLTGLWYTYLGGNLLPTDYKTTLKDAGMGGTIYEDPQSILKLKDTAIKSYTIENGTDFTNIDLFSLLEIDNNGALLPISSNHTLVLENYVDENNIPVDLDTYLKDNVVLKTGKVYAQIRATGLGLFPNNSPNALTADKIELDFQLLETLTYKLSFDLNGATSRTIPAEQVLPEGAKALSVEIPTKTGYTFTGWNTAQNGSGTAWDFNATTMPATNVTLYAQWKVNNYAIHFNPNGGTGAMSDEPYTYGESKPLYKDTYTREGYTFKGWSTTPTGSVEYGDESSYTFNSLTDVTLYAQWEKQVGPTPTPENPISTPLSTSTTTPTSNSAKTGDTSHNSLYFLLGLVGMTGLILMRKKQTNR